MRQYAVRSETVEWWIKPLGDHTFNPELAAERYTDADKQLAMAKGVGRVSEASLNKGRPPRKPARRYPQCAVAHTPCLCVSAGTWMDIPRENSRSKERRYGKHPTMKPLMLAERLINVHSNLDDTVLIPFAGSGSEVVMAYKLGRTIIAYETEDDYITLMRARFEGHGVSVAFE